MIEVLTHPITLLCLGVIFILCALLFFYFKRSMMVIENAQVEQATVLRKFIASMEMRKFDNSQMQMPSNEDHVLNFSGGENNNINIRNSTSAHQDQTSLIDVSDNESSSEEEEDAYSETNAYETEESDSESEMEIKSEYSITSSPSQDKKESNIKVINVEDLEDLNKTFSEYKDKRHGSDKRDVDINDIDEDSVSTSCDDMFSTDLDRMEKECDIDMKRLDTTSFIHSHDDSHVSSLNMDTDASQQQEKFEHFDQMSILLSHDDFKGYTVSQIRDYAMHNDIIRKGDKMKKKELVDHVIESNIQRGAENLKVNKVGSDRQDEEINILVEKELDEVELDRQDQSTEKLSQMIQITPSLQSEVPKDDLKIHTSYDEVESFEVELLEK